MRPRPPHSDAAHAAIAAELVRLTLPHRGAERPELVSPIAEGQLSR